MTSFTLDTNCIIALENGEPTAADVRLLAEAHTAKRADVALVSASASERQPGDRRMVNYGEFVERVGSVGLDQLPVLPTIAYFDLGFWDVGLYGSTKEMIEREREIHQALFPTIPFAWPEFAAGAGVDASATETRAAKPWRNAFCDRQMFWAHDHNRRDVFVTSDTNFRRKLAGHPRFPTATVATPAEAVAML